MMQTKVAAKQSKIIVAQETLFSRKLYADTLRGLRFTGLLLTLASVLITLAQLLPHLGRDAFGLNPNVFGNVPTVFALLSPAVLMMQTFFFLYRRNGSDLYHGLPYTRRCLGLSLTAASLTWSCAAVTLPLAACAVLIPFSPSPFPMAILGWMLVHHLTVVLLITGCALIGASLSGTPLTGVLITGMALFLPRWTITVYRYFLVNVSGMMSYTDTGWLLSPGLHLPTADLVLLTRQRELPRFLGMTYTQFFHNAPGILCTLALSAAALAIGLRCFIRRRSELAGQAVARSWAYSVLHATVAFASLLGAICVVYQGYRRFQGNWMANPRLTWAAAVVVCFALYLVFVWFRTKSWRSVLQAAPFIALAAACGFAVCWGGTTAGLQTRTGLPAAAEIASVRFPSDAGDRDVFFGWENGLNLLAGQVSDVRYDAPELREFASTAISNRAAMLEEHAARKSEYLESGKPVSIEVTLADGGTLRRTVDLPEEQVVRLQQLLLASPDFMGALRQTPESPRLMMGSIEVASLPEGSDTDAMWQAFRTELNVQSDVDFVRHTDLEGYLSSTIKRESYYDNDRLRYKANLRAYAWRGMDLCNTTYYVGPKTPATLDACVREINRLWGADYQEARKAAEAVGFQRDIVSYSMEFTYVAQVNGRAQLQSAFLSPLPSWEEAYRDTYIEEAPDRETYEAFRVDEEKQLRDILCRSALAVDGEEPLVAAFIHVKVRRDDGVNETYRGSVYLKVSDADFTLLQELLQRRLQNEEIYPKGSNG